MIVIPSDTDEPDANEPISLTVEDADVEVRLMFNRLVLVFFCFVGSNMPLISQLDI